MKRIGFIVIGLLVPVMLFSQKPGEDGLAEAEGQLYNLYEWLYTFQDDQQRLQMNDTVLSTFESVLSSYGSFDYPFDSLKRIGKLYSPDHSFRIITWNIPWQDGTHSYYGFIQLPVKKENRCEVIRLIDRSDEIEDPEHQELSHDRWFGVLYYNIVMHRHGGLKFYTLIGFDYDDRFSNKKIIDVLTFENGTPVFGKPVFEPEGGGNLQHRLIYEYAPDIVMTLRYDQRYRLIVLDHLSPIEPVFKGNHKFYAPDISYDGYKWKKGTWRYQPDIDVRNR